MLLEIPVGGDYAGQRAERFLRRNLPRLGMGRLQSLFRRREIKVDRRPVDRSYRLAEGDVVQVFGLRPEEGEGAGRRTGAEDPGPALPMPPVLHEDGELLVVDKPAGMAAHPGTGIPPGASLIERVRSRSGAGGGFPASLVHRLDKETSGVLMVAKTGPRLRALAEILRAGRLRKRYLALVAGTPSPREGTIDLALAREDSAAGAKAVAAEGGKRAVSHYRVLEEIGQYSLVQVIIETGRMHQIRAHLAHLGHPVAGDTRYRRPGDARRQRKDLGIARIFLHAEEVSWDEGGRTRRFRSPMPPELQAALRRLSSSPRPA